MRILCLHGTGTNTTVFKTQTEHVRYDLERNGISFEFVEGALKCAPAHGVSQIFPSMSEFFTYYDPRSAESVLTAQRDLIELLNAEDRFDGVLAFSEGAALAASLIVRHQRDNPFDTVGLFRFAIFIAGVPPFNQDSIEKAARTAEFSATSEYNGPSDTSLARVLPETDGIVLHLPTVHIFGRNDVWYNWGLALSKICDIATSTVIIHDGGHEVPRNPRSVVVKMNEAISATIERANIIQ